MYHVNNRENNIEQQYWAIIKQLGKSMYRLKMIVYYSFLYVLFLFHGWELITDLIKIFKNSTNTISVDKPWEKLIIKLDYAESKRKVIAISLFDIILAVVKKCSNITTQHFS